MGATITIDISAQDNQPPSSSGWLSLSLTYNQSYTFTLANFTTETTPAYVDPEGDVLHSIKIVTLPSTGTLKRSGVNVTANDIITSADLSGGLLTYDCDAGETEGYSDSDMTFLVSDVGSTTFTTSPNIVYITAGYDISSENQAPDVVGDGEQDGTVGYTFTFTIASLTTELNPPYSDPEGNPAYKLKVVSVPVDGDILLDGNLVVDGQEIFFYIADSGAEPNIESGDLVYKNNEFPEGGIDGFEFQISDSVSKQYTG